MNNALLIRRRGMMKARQGGMIPISWLQGSHNRGKTWINTGIKGKNTISVEGAFINNGQGVSTENNWIFGSRRTSNVTNYFALLLLNVAQDGFSWRRGSSASLGTHPNDNEEVLFSNIVELNKLVLTYNNNTFTVVGNPNYQGNDSDIGLFTIVGPTGNPSTMNPSDSVKLEWIKKSDVYGLNLWEGDKIFFKLLKERKDFFSLKLVYDGKDNLIEADLDGKKMDYKEYLKNIK